MLRKVSLAPEIAHPLGLSPGSFDDLGAFVALVGLNGAGKSRCLQAVSWMMALAPRTDEIRAALSQRIDAAPARAERERLGRSLRLIEALARPGAILVDGEGGPRPPSSEDRCIDLTYRTGISSDPVTAVFSDLPRPESAPSFASVQRSAPAYLRRIATALFYGQHPEAARRPDVRAALREAERFNEIARALLGKEVTPEMTLNGGLDIMANLGGRPFQLDDLSAGEGLLLTWALLLHQEAPSLERAVVMIDEPELHLHPSLPRQLLSSLRKVLGDRGQMWVATHSPVVLAHPEVTNRFLLERGAVRPLDLGPSPPDERALGLVVDKPPLPIRSPTAAKPPVGVDFRAIMEGSESLVYVDKTEFIEQVLRNPGAVLLFPRPRRFGKSLNLSALRYFVEKSAESRRRGAWFKGLRVWQSAEARAHFGRYPVIHVTFKETKAHTFSDLFKRIRNILAELYEQHAYLLEEASLGPSEKAYYEKIQRAEGEPEDCELALKRLSRHLESHHGERVVMLVDEYDTPLHEAYDGGYLGDAARFFGNLLSAGLKDNPHLFKGVLTGVLRVARDSLFSELNNLSVYSILHPEFATCFGFTEAEVDDLCRRLGSPDLMDGLRQWYNGYLFGEEVLFNPWSVMSCLASADRRLAPYWADTSSMTLMRKLLFEQGRGLDGELSALLRGQAIRKPVEENLVLRSLDSTPDAVWSLLLFAGYLKPAGPHAADPMSASLTIPNLEVRRELERLVRECFSTPIGGEGNAERMWRAVLRGDAEELERYLNQILTHNMSSSNKDTRLAERLYQMLLLGMLVFLPSYDVESEMFSGHGRCDLLLVPRSEGEPGVCMELKVTRDDDWDTRLDDALRQIDGRRYTARLERKGASPIHTMAVVFQGQRAWVRSGKPTSRGRARSPGRKRSSGR